MKRSSFRESCTFKMNPLSLLTCANISMVAFSCEPRMAERNLDIFLEQDVPFVNACSCYSMTSTKMFKRSDSTNTLTDYKADLFLKERTFV